MSIMENELEKEIFKVSKQEFSEMVEDLVRNQHVTYIEALAELCEQHDFEPEKIKTLLTLDLKANIEIEAEKLNLLKEKKKRLDI